MNVLITSASRKVSLVRSFQKALAEEGGGGVVAVDVSPMSPALYVADSHYLVPPLDSGIFLDAILAICRTHGIRLLVPTRDEDLPWFAARRASFAAVGARVMVADPEVVAVCQDKARFGEFCRTRGVPVPRSFNAATLPGDIAFPLFLKPRHGKGSKNTSRIENATELSAALEEMPDAVVQEFVDAQEYTIDLFADFEGNVISAVPRERTYVFGGESFVSRTVNHPALIENAVRLARELGLVGHNTIQCFFDGREVKFIEVNPRFGGAAHLSFEAGAPSPRFLVKLLRGEPLTPQIGTFRDGYVMLRYTEDLFLDSKSLTDRTVS